jgi:hypothetical protein
MLKSYEAIYEHGRIRWLETPPDVDQARVIVTVLPPPVAGASATVPERHHRPPERLKGSTRVAGDIVSSLHPDDEWEAMFERTARQLKGDPEAFR